eukprot:evm.model.scf_1805EXC.1 EVM.evm.TU.scf_1805EXC.1   scf_1805EXC:11972-19110(-)
MAGPSGWGSSREQDTSFASSDGKPTVGRHSGVVGLKNLHNTCFMNSSLQCLAHTPPLVHPFVSGSYRDDINTANLLGYKGEVAEAFGEVMEEVWLGRDHYYAPRGFKQTVCNNTFLFEEGRHHDTQEFLGWALDGLHEDLNKAEKKPYRKLDDDPDRTDLHVAQEAWEYYRDRNTSLMSDHCTGMYKCTTTCLNCGSVSRRFDPVMTVTLQLPHPATRHFIFTVIEVDGSKAPCRHAVEVDWEGSVEDLYTAVSGALGVEDSDMNAVIYIAVVHGHAVQRTLQKMHESLDRIGFDDELVVYKYPNKEQGPLSGGMETHIQHRKPATYSFPMTFGTPLVFWVKEENMADATDSKKRGALHEMLDRALRPYKRRAVEQDEDWGKHGTTDMWARGHYEHAAQAVGEASGEDTNEWERVGQRSSGNSPASSTQCACGSGDETMEFGGRHSSGGSDCLEPTRIIADCELGRAVGGSDMDEKQDAGSSKGCAPSPERSPMCSDQGVDDADDVAEASQHCAEDGLLDGGLSGKQGEGEASAESACLSTECSAHCSPGGGCAANVEVSEEAAACPEEQDCSEKVAEAPELMSPGEPEDRSMSPPTAVRSGGNGVEIGEEATSPRGTFCCPEEDDRGPYVGSLFDEDDGNQYDGDQYGSAYGHELSAVTDRGAFGGATGPDSAYRLRELWGCMGYYSDRKSSQKDFVLEWAGDHHKFFDLSCLASPETDPSVQRARLAQNHKAHSVDLDHLFEVFQQPTRLSGHNAYACDRCKKQVPAQNCFNIFELPEILVIQIKRFENRGNGEGWERNSMLVEFPIEGLDMSPYVAIKQDTEPVYDLYAVLNHYGSVRMGHYTAYCQHFNGKWYHFDDEYVSEVSPRVVVSTAAYVLFYRRRVDAQKDPEDIVSMAMKERRESGRAWQRTLRDGGVNCSSYCRSRDMNSSRFQYPSTSSPTCSRYSEGPGAAVGWEACATNSSNGPGHFAGSGDSSNGNAYLLPGGPILQSGNDTYGEWNKSSYYQNSNFSTWDIGSSSNKHWSDTGDAHLGTSEPGTESDKENKVQDTARGTGMELVLYTPPKPLPINDRSEQPKAENGPSENGSDDRQVCNISR